MDTNPITLPCSLARTGNKLDMRRKLHSLRLKESDSVQDHIRQMTEIFNALSVMEAPLSEEDRVIYHLASLPESFGMLVTALEASAEVPKMDVVTERLHEQRKLSSEKKKGAPVLMRRLWQHGPSGSRKGVHVNTVESTDISRETVRN